MFSKAAQNELRLTLQRELERRMAKNPAYSLRAMAKTMGVSPATLSQLLREKRGLSKVTRGKIAGFLGLNPESEQQDQLAETQFIQQDFFEVVCDWHHFAILSLTETLGFHPDAKWVSKRLGISVHSARASLERLFRLKLLVEASPGKWTQASSPFRLDERSSTIASRRFQKQLLAKAMDSLEQIKPTQRDLTSITFAMDAALVEFAVKRIAKFRRKLCEELEALSPAPNEVFNISIQIFPLTKSQKKEVTL